MCSITILVRSCPCLGAFVSTASIPPVFMKSVQQHLNSNLIAISQVLLELWDDTSYKSKCQLSQKPQDLPESALGTKCMFVFLCFVSSDQLSPTYICCNLHLRCPQNRMYHTHVKCSFSSSGFNQIRNESTKFNKTGHWQIL